ncbi:MAG: DNA polymerase I [Ruminococcaceae bacterium]|nr:DNA polymerase I [Oscillospiraceae bacterium]
MKKILILDANSLLNRAFYGIRPLSNSQGLPTNAIFGYINILKKHLDAVKPDYAAAAFDLHAPTFRHKFDERYKATRKPMPEELRAQMPYLHRATEALGIAVVEREGYEADDILGTLSRIAEEGGDRAFLVTGDRDAYQLVSDSTTLILAGTGKDEEITPAVIREKFGLSPRQMIDVKALAGDSGDNIPGVRGIGEKTALKLVGLCGDLDGVYADLDALPVGPSAKEKLLAGKEDAYKSRFLGEICREVPTLSRIEDFPYTGFVPELLLPLLVELEFTKMIGSFGLTEPPKEPDAPLQGTLFDLAEEKSAVEELDAAEVTDAVFPLFYDDASFYALIGEKPVQLCGDVETLLRRSRPVVCDCKAYLHRFADAFGDFEGVEADFDLFLAAYVLDSQHASMTLSAMGRSFCKDGAYLSADTDPAEALPLMARLSVILREKLENASCKELYYSTELPLARVLAEMERVGFAVSREGIETYGKNLLVITDALQEEIFRLAGEEFLISSPKQLGRILFEKLGLPPGKKTKTGYATDAETLSKLRFHSPIIDLILNWRTAAKLRSTYVEGMLKQIRSDGRIHTVFNGMLTATGRLSSAEPNLQNIPVKTELGREMRRFFIASEGCVLVDADYSQIELRLLAHMSGDETMQQFFLDGRDIHTKTASEIFHVAPEQVTPEMRKSAKAVNFGIVYGIGEYSLSQDLGVPMRVAKDYIEKYFALFPRIKGFLDGTKAQAHEDGFVTTLFGRRRYIPELQSSKKPLVAFGERVAMNAPIQGTAADIIKIAMVRVARRLKEEGLRSRLILQVHDELILECPEEEAELAARLLSEEMEGAVSYSVPLIAESSLGKTWFDAK